MPTENVKQKMQAGLHSSAKETIAAILKSSGAKGFYTGYLTTVVREVPFSFIQFPIYEWLKVRIRARNGLGRMQQAGGGGGVRKGFGLQREGNAKALRYFWESKRRVVLY